MQSLLEVPVDWLRQELGTEDVVFSDLGLFAGRVGRPVSVSLAHSTGCVYV